MRDLSLRPIRSYVRRRGRKAPSNIADFAPLLSRYGIAFVEQLLDIEVLFQRKAPLVLEIGFGMGDALVEMAEAHPELDFIGIEVHHAGVLATLRKIEAKQISNIRIIEHDAVDVLEKMILPLTFSRIQIFFPDPWHKKRHQKRRLIQDPFMISLLEKLESGGILHLATDWEDYALQMEAVIAHFPILQTATEGPFCLSRAKTKFEKRGERLGHAIWDFVFKKAK